MLVVDAMTGQDAVNAAQTFNEWLDIDGVMLTKLDGDARGGAALSVKAVTGKPIKFAGTGEKLEDDRALPPRPDGFPDSGHGRRAYAHRKGRAGPTIQKKAAELEQKLRTNKFTLQDFYDQLVQLEEHGLHAGYAGHDARHGAALKNVQVDETAMGRTEAIILSMTPYERENPAVHRSHAGSSRIAAGCGLQVEDVNTLLKQFDQMQQAHASRCTAPARPKSASGCGRHIGGMRFPGM